MEELDKGRNTQFDGDISDIMIELVRGGEISVKGPRVVTPWVFQDADEGASSVYPAPGIAARESGA
jgi:hypothetical protein